MPRNPAPVVPRWKRGKVQHPAMPVQLRGRHARAFTRELARNAQPPGSAGKEGRAGKAAGNDVLASTGAWRFRRHMAPFAWLTGLIAAGLVLHRTSHPLLYGNIAGLAVPVLMILLTRQGPPFIRRAADVAAVVTSVWLTLLGAFGLHACIPWLLLTWAPCAALWVRQYRWRPAEPGTTEAVAADAAIWERLAAKRRWSGRLADREDIPGGRKYQIRLDGIETHIGQVMSEPRAIAAAFHKPQTEAYVEPHPTGIESRGVLTILKGGTLQAVQEWDGQGVDETGLARIGRFADSQPAHVRFLVRRDGTRHGLIAGASGAGKTITLDLFIWLAITGKIPIVPVILDPQNGQSLPQWRGKLLYAAGVEECIAMLRGLHAGMLRRSHDLAAMTWTDDDGHENRGMSFFDPETAGLPVVLIIIDEAPVMLSGSGNARLAAEAVRLAGEIAKLGRKTGVSLWPVAQVPSLAELGDQVVRSMLVGGNVVCLRTGDRVSAGMLGLETDPSVLPKYFPGGEPTGGLGYVVGPDNRQAPMRISPVPGSMRRSIPPIPVLDDRFAEVMQSVMLSQGVLLTSGPVPEPAVPADDAPDGRRCIDATWQVLADSGKPMERGEVIKWVNELAQTGWGRDKPFSIRAIGDALNKLVTDPPAGKSVTKVRDGVYAADTADRSTS